MEKHDVVIIGAGPGGLSAAKMLATYGKDVLVLDKDPEDKLGTIGGEPFAKFITRSAMRKLPSTLYNMFTQKHRFHNYEISLDILDFKTAVVDCVDLAQWQLKTAKSAGAEIRDQSYVSKVMKKDNKIVLMDGEEIGYNYLIAAHGTNVNTAKMLGLKTNPAIIVGYILDGKIDDVISINYNTDIGWQSCWIIPWKKCTFIGSGDFAVFHQLRKKRRDLERWFEEERGINLKDGREISRTINWVWNGFKHKNIFLVGDAASFNNTLAQFGIGQAIESGEIAAKAIIDERYNYKKDVKMLYRHHKTMGLGETSTEWMRWIMDTGSMINSMPKMLDITKRAAKKIESSRLGNLLWSSTNNFIVKHLIVNHPAFCQVVYWAYIYAPTTMSSMETMKRWMEYVYNMDDIEENY